jgi:adenylate cyclase class IV
MREVELKAVVADPERALRALEAAGARLEFRGRLEDRRYDTADRSLALRDHVLRLRLYRGGHGGAAPARALLDFKGPTEYVDGYKVREEHSVEADSDTELERILDLLGYQVTREIHREIRQFRIEGAVVRFEWYPRMDVLVEVEGEPEAIERAIAAMQLDRADFTTGRLPDFVRAYEARTGERAAICDRELDGDYRYSATDA